MIEMIIFWNVPMLTNKQGQKALDLAQIYAEKAECVF